MNNDTLKAIKLMKDEDCTCVLCKGDIVHRSMQRGVLPLVEWINAGENLSGFSASDKVVGKAAAFLYILMGVTAVYADIMSDAAIDILTKFGIRAHCGKPVRTIKSRVGTGQCPMELLVCDIDTPKEAFAAIRNKLLDLRTAVQ